MRNRNLKEMVRSRLRHYVLGLIPHVECNVCNLRARELGDGIWHARTECWVCGSRVRHRLLVAAFNHIEPYSYAKLIDGKDILHFGADDLSP